MSAFADAFGHEAAAHGAAPGRVNLLGEHTDYNDGFVLPTVTPQQTRVAAGLSTAGHFRACSAQSDERVAFEPGEKPSSGFGRYVYGCVEELRRAGFEIPPLDFHVSSDVPIGVGLSSSAALEVAILRSIRALLGLELSDLRIAQLAQRAEVEHVGVRCGLLDQMAASLGGSGSMLFIDMRSLEFRSLPLPGRVMVIDTGTRRSLASTAYNSRRTECEEAARELGVRALRDVEDVSRLSRLPPPLDRRARHVVTENLRVLRAVDAAAGQFGRLMNESHASLRDDFEVSTPALDLLARTLQEQPGVFGARLTGAGFGGACVALVEPGAAEHASAVALDALRRAGFAGRVLIRGDADEQPSNDRS
jgi:galactokinase